MGDPLPAAQWQEVKALFDRALEVPPAERAALVENATADVVVRREVLALLAAHEGADRFLEPPCTDTAPLPRGHRLGPYEIVTHIGRGGMSDVYRARDARLGRDVAVKVPRVLDKHARQRFVREARATAALSHDNVLALFDVGETNGVAYLVTELLEGETLRARLQRELPAIRDAIEWTIQIARGLAEAHHHGVVHRDLKPENVMLLDGDRVKILDFGIARAPEQELGEANDTALSMPGAILGTVGYLAPEQARGKPVKPSADLFALGAILYEALTGQRAFHAETTIDTLRAILDTEPPPPSSLRDGIPPALDRVVARCLVKDAAHRFESARDLEFAVQLAIEPIEVPVRSRRLWIWPVAAALVFVAVIVAVRLRSAATSPGEPPRVYPLTSSGNDRHPAVSPDGRFLAFTSDRDGTSRIWLQQQDVGREKPLTEGPDSAPRFSPDGSQILFTRSEGARQALYRVGLLGGELHRVASDASDGDWSPDGRHVAFIRLRSHADRITPLVMIAQIDGGNERELAKLDERASRGRGVEQRVRWSPDGTRLAVSGFAQLPGTPQRILLIPLDGSAPRSIAAPRRVGLVSAVAWEDADTLVYSQALSVSANSVGSAARIVRHRISDQTVSTVAWLQQSSLVVDRWPNRGLVADARLPHESLREIAIADASSRQLSRGTAIDRQPQLSPDGKQLVFTSNRGGNHLDIWIVDRATGTSNRLTDHPADDWDPAFTPDGQHLLWSSDRGGHFEIWMAERDGSKPRQISNDGVDAENPSATPDGRYIVYASGAPGRTGIWRVNTNGTGATRLVPDAILPALSPDGRYVAYQRTRDATTIVVGVAQVADGARMQFEIPITIYRQTFAILGRPRWTPDGKSLAFIGQDERGATGIFVQEMDPIRDTSTTRRPLGGFDRERVIETFDIDATHLILAETVERTDVVGITLTDRATSSRR